MNLKFGLKWYTDSLLVHGLTSLKHYNRTECRVPLIGLLNL